jgi:hypothetical protein
MLHQTKIGAICFMRAFGPFHRKETKYQTPQDALKQVSSGEIWGSTPKNGGMCPTVQAYPGQLSDGRRGIEFSTDIESESGSSPIEARWYLGLTSGVEERFDQNANQYACISAKVVNVQP